MRVVTALALSLPVCGLGYIGGRHLYDGAATEFTASRIGSASLPQLPNPHAIAQQTREQLAKLPASLWAPVQTDTSQAVIDPPVPALPQAAVPQLTEASRQSPESAQQPPDPSEMIASLRSSISAIVRSNGTTRLVVANPNTTVRRSLVVGDTYQDGWKVQKIEGNSVVLSRQGRNIHVSIGVSANFNRPARFAQAQSAQNPTQRSPDSIQPASPDQSQRRIIRRSTVQY